MSRICLLLLLLASLLGAADSTGRVEELRRELGQKSLAERGPVLLNLVNALTARGDGELARQEFRSSLASYLEALELTEQNPGLVVSPRMLNNAGVSAISLGEYDRALQLLLKALAAADTQGDPVQVITSNHLIGYVHRDVGNYDLALRHFRDALKQARAQNNLRFTIKALNEIGNVHTMSKNFAEALTAKKEALKLARTSGDPSLLANTTHDLGALFFHRGQVSSALRYYQEALAIDRRLGNLREMTIALTNIAQCHLRLKKPAAGLPFLAEAGQLAEKQGQKGMMIEILSTYAQLFEEQQDFRKALEYLRRHLQLWKEVRSEEKAKWIVEMQGRSDMEKKQRENESLRKEKLISDLARAKEHDQRNFLLFLTLLVLALALVLYRLFRLKERANRLISAQQAKLAEAYREMESLAQHDQLTGLPNRRAVMAELDREAHRFQRNQRPFSLLMADMVGFKKVNDTVGHDAGDYVLQTAAGIFSASLRAQDTVARLGGDEFLFLLPETDQAGGQLLAATIRERIAGHRFEYNGHLLNVAVSLGAGTFQSGMSVEDCLRQADQEMYRSRQPFSRSSP